MEAKTLALYLGCDVVHTDADSKYNGLYRLFSVDVETDVCRIRSNNHNGVTFGFNTKYDKLLLRPLSSVTEKESSECPRLLMDKWGNATLESMAKLVNHLRSLGVDCDGLIEKGEAIDSTKL